MALFKPTEIAKYLAELLKKDKNLDTRVTALERKGQDGRAPAVPLAGQPVFNPQQYEVVRVTSIVGATVFVGKRCEPHPTTKWAVDEDLQPIEVDVPVGHSCPGLDDTVLAVFVGTYQQGGSEKARYGMFAGSMSECRIGITTESVFTYPVAAANVYEVQTYKGSFSETPGNQTINKTNWEVVVAAAWGDTVTLIPKGTKIIVHPHNNHWWFQQPTFCDSVCYTSCSSAISLVDISTM